MRRSPKRSRFCRHQAAYTLFEIMLVLGIISVLVGSSIYLLVNNIDVAKEQRVEADFQAISMQVKSYEIMNYVAPTTEQGLAALVKKPSSNPAPRKWKQLLETVPLDPWGTPYQYRNPGTYNPTGFDLYSWGADRKESDDDLFFKKSK